VQCLRWYSYRWLIERYHYVLKSGCRIEQLQLESADRIHRALATYTMYPPYGISTYKLITNDE